MPEKKSQGEEIMNFWHDPMITDEGAPPRAILHALCAIATQLERIADRMDDILETGLPTR